jgi:hypothetical protein
MIKKLKEKKKENGNVTEKDTPKYILLLISRLELLLVLLFGL